MSTQDELWSKWADVKSGLQICWRACVVTIVGPGSTKPENCQLRKPEPCMGGLGKELKSDHGLC